MSKWIVAVSWKGLLRIYRLPIGPLLAPYYIYPSKVAKCDILGRLAQKTAVTLLLKRRPTSGCTNS